MALRVRDGTRSIAAAIGTVIHPVSDQPLGVASETDRAIGMGLHGEGGTLLGGDVAADDISALLVGRVVDDAGIGAGGRVGLLINNSGSVTLMELSILYRGAVNALRERGIDAGRSWIGSYATTLDQAGFSFAISALDLELGALYYAPAHGAGFVSIGAVAWWGPVQTWPFG